MTALRVAPLRLSDRVVADPPVVLAPMAGITNAPFRRLCREAMRDQLAPGQAGGLFVSEMITSRALVERNAKTMQLIHFDADESPRSIQLYGVDPAVVGAAVRMIVDEDLADHVDLNFGCPVPKVTRKGGGSALPWRIGLFDDIVTTAVREARGAVPVTVKMRVGIDPEHVTYREAGLRAQDAGVAHVALHGRTAMQFYGGHADWTTVADLAGLLDIPVLGNGDIWEGDDALRMVRETGCAGVVVGRGCLGRPWLFADLAAAFNGSAERTRPGLAEVARTMYRHAELLTEWTGEQRGGTERRLRSDQGDVGLPRDERSEVRGGTERRLRSDQGDVGLPRDERSEVRGGTERRLRSDPGDVGLPRDERSEVRGVTEFRKHVAWYLKGFSVGGQLRASLAAASGLGELADLLGRLELDQPFPTAVVGQPRGRTAGGRPVSLPEGWLDSRESRAVPCGAELVHSGAGGG